MPSAVQHRSTFGNSVSSLALAFTSNNAAGNALVYCTGGGITTATAATDSNTNTIANATSITGSGSTGANRIDYVANSNSGANTVTAHQGAAVDLHIHLWEISGCVTSSPVRASGTVSSSATASVSTSTSTPLSGDAVVAFFMDFPNNDSLVAGTGYTPSEFSNNTTGLDGALSEYKSATASGTQTATLTGNGTSVLSQAILVLIQSSSGITTGEMMAARQFVEMPVQHKIEIVSY